MNLQTLIQKINELDNDYAVIKKAAQYIRQGEVVAFPTETVYGLGANALDGETVRKIFYAKGRPSDNPLIVHIASINEIYQLVNGVPPKALKLMEAFWPGPITIILEKSSIIPDEVTAGLDTVGIRMPRNEVARAFIKECGVPIAAPSANRSGRPSPTTAQHVMEDMQGRIPFIIDGGECSVGLESTVLDLTSNIPTILRPGGITQEMLETVLGEVQVDKRVLTPPLKGERVKSPGMKYTHYAPKAPVTIVQGNPDAIAKHIKALAMQYISQGKKVGILATEETYTLYEDIKASVLIMGTRSRLSTIASKLFADLRQFDDLGVDIILAEGVGTKDEGLAIMNRMLRAAGFHVINI
ncbi:L-threonylcarbamoyladenylate synthase [Xylanivirga thermophila]|uniref:L-threonylcarbamoyladenylate synthase n=1 Tax=Xylanivirga thermophila TaxID=2496273 RepID=UPI00101D17DA|nr:L-threonylcarbamoyladenylate synthase [Xylanivirga thermophila]